MKKKKKPVEKTARAVKRAKQTKVCKNCGTEIDGNGMCGGGED